MKKFTLTLLAAVCGLFANAAVSSVDDLVGVYSVTGTGTESVTNYYAQTNISESSYDVTIGKNDDGTVSISNFFGLGYTLKGTVDLDAKTITIAGGQQVEAYMTFASSTDNTGSVVATFDDDAVITVANFGAWYGSYKYVSDDATFILKKASITKDWDVTGTLIYYNDEVLYHSEEATLTKYTGSSSYDYILEFSNKNATPNNIKFTVADDGMITITNGSASGSYKYFYDLADNIYCAGFYTANNYSYFEGNDKDGEVYFYHYGYETSSTTDADAVYGYVDFSWGTKDGISAVTTDKAKDGAIYDLTGRKVTDAKKAGIYIQNGKKFVVK